MGTFSSPLPVGSRFTSGFGKRWGTLHAGTDYAPPKPGQSGVPVFAVHDGPIIDTGYGYGRASDVIPYHSGRFIWQDIGVHGGDRMRIYYGHLADLDVNPGDHVKAGQVIGEVGGSGKSGENHFAKHLHIGVAQNHARPVHAATGYGKPGWINAHSWLLSKGIAVGQDEPVAFTKPASSKPKSANVRSESSIKNICIKAGHGNSSNSLFLLIQRYQHRQLYPFQLVHDSVWGQVTENHYRWVLTLQQVMNKWKGYDVPVDGDYRAKTVERVRNIQERNKYGAYKGYRIDGIPGPVFCKMLGISTHP